MKLKWKRIGIVFLILMMKPVFDKKGQAEICGPWYEGKIPYEHKNYMSFNEVQEAYAGNLEKLGFQVFR